MQGLKRHLNLCRNMPKDQPAKLKQEAALEDIDFSDVDGNTCFCCLESKESAHVSTEVMITGKLDESASLINFKS